MKNHNSPLLDSLHGKTIKSHHVSNSHGEVLILHFTDGTELHVCTTFGLYDKTIEEDRNAIYVTVNDEVV
jgi:hypothetical protein